MMPLLPLLLACQAPFGTDRHDLVGDRIAAVQLLATDAPTQFEVRAWRVVDGRPWSDEALGLRWYWLDALGDIDAVDPLDPAAATGPSPRLDLRASNGRRVLGLIARFPDGTEHRLALPLRGDQAAPVAERMRIRLSVVPDLPFEEPAEEDLALAARRALVPEPAEFVPEATWARLRARFEGAGRVPRALDKVRWMATNGTFLELDEVTTDWAPSDLVLDELEIDERTDLSPQIVTFLALALDGGGHNAVAARDVFFGEPADGVWLNDRFLPMDGPAPAGDRLLGTLTADDDAPSGLRFTDVTAVSLTELPFPDPWGTADLPCAVPVEGPFDPNWLFDGRCTRADVVGARVVGVPR